MALNLEPVIDGVPTPVVVLWNRWMHAAEAYHARLRELHGAMVAFWFAWAAVNETTAVLTTLDGAS